MKLRSVVGTALMLTLLVAPVVVSAQGLNTIKPFEGTSGSSLIDAVRFIINGLLILAALAASIYLIVGGLRYIVSQGDEEKATSAKNTILFAVIGLIVIGLSAAIVNFVVTAIQNS